MPKQLLFADAARRKMLDSGERSPIALKEGDEVLFGKYSGTDIKVDGDEVKILRETDILAKIL